MTNFVSIRASRHSKSFRAAKIIWNLVTRTDRRYKNQYIYETMERGGYVYIMSNARRTVLYIGVTSALYWRAIEHKKGMGSVFTKKYKCVDLIYYEVFSRIEEAIAREKQLKAWRRIWKDELIKKKNPELEDLTAKVENMV